MIYQAISAAFCIIVVLSNIFSAKMVALPFWGLVVPAGLLSYPLTFLLSDIVTEIYGAKYSRWMVMTALGMNLLSLVLIHFVLLFPDNGHDTQKAFQVVLGLSSLRIISSLVAYLSAQFVDIQIYAALKNRSGSRLMWFRNNVSTWVSQLVDTLTIDIIFLWWGLGMPMMQVAPIMVFSYTYKALFSVATTPLLYLAVYLIKKLPISSHESQAYPHHIG
jgi:uncharacterized integral membrane protein (TIGR00697 family)